MRRVLGSLLCATALVAGGCSKSANKPAAGGTPTPTATAETVTGAQTYTIDLDYPSPDGKQYQFSAFYPKSVRVRPGDTVVFDNKSTQSIHTVSFGVASDRSNQPSPEDKGSTNVAVFGPCFMPDDPKPTLTACVAASGSGAASPSASASGSASAGTSASPSAGASTGGPAAAPPEYTGKGYWNSGAVPGAFAGPNAPPAGARKVTVKLSDAISPGSYHVVCLLHPYMDGTVEVVNKDGDRVSPDAVAKAGAAAYEQDEENAGKLAEPKPATETGKTTVVAGAGDKIVAINAFFPSSVKVKAGDSVVWKNESAYEPHTVTLNGNFQGPEDKGALGPGGVKSGKDFSGGFAHSGLFGPAPFFPADSFSLKFTKKGSYIYRCILHPGMGGVVEVE